MPTNDWYRALNDWREDAVDAPDPVDDFYGAVNDWRSDTPVAPSRRTTNRNTPQGPQPQGPQPREYYQPAPRQQGPAPRPIEPPRSTYKVDPLKAAINRWQQSNRPETVQYEAPSYQFDYEVERPDTGPAPFTAQQYRPPTVQSRQPVYDPNAPAQRPQGLNAWLPSNYSFARPMAGDMAARAVLDPQARQTAWNLLGTAWEGATDSFADYEAENYEDNYKQYEFDGVLGNIKNNVTEWLSTTPGAQQAENYRQWREANGAWQADTPRDEWSWDRVRDMFMSGLYATTYVPGKAVSTTQIPGSRYLADAITGEEGDDISAGQFLGSVGEGINRVYNKLNPNYIEPEEDDYSWIRQGLVYNIFEDALNRSREARAAVEALGPEANPALVNLMSGGDRTLKGATNAMNQEQDVANFYAQAETLAQEADALEAEGRYDEAAQLRMESAQAGRAGYDLSQKSKADLIDEQMNPWAEIIGEGILDPLNLVDFRPVMRAFKAMRARQAFNISEEAAVAILNGPEAPEIFAFADWLDVPTGDGLTIRQEVIGPDAKKWLQRINPGNIWERTGDTKAHLATDTLYRAAAQLLTDVTDKETARQVLGLWATDPAQLVRGIQTRQGVYQVGGGVLANPYVTEYYPMLRQMAEAINTLPELAGKGGFNPIEVLSALNDTFYRSARGIMGLDVLPQMPTGTLRTRVVKTEAGMAVVEYLDKKGKVISRSAEMVSTEAYKTQKTIREAVKSAGPGGSDNKLAQVWGVQKAILSDMYLGQSPGYWLKNALSATTHLLADDNYTLLPTTKIIGDLDRWYGGAPTTRGLAAQTGAIGGASSDAMGGGLHWLQRIFPKNYYSRLMNRLYDIPFGATDIAGRIPFGEQNFALRGTYVPIKRYITSGWTDATQRFTQALEAAGVQPDFARTLGGVARDAGINGNKQRIAQEVRKTVTAATVRQSLSELGVPDELLDARSWADLQDIFDSYTPAEVAEAAAEVRRVFAEEFKRPGQILNSAPPTPSRDIFTAAESAQDGAAFIDDTVEAARRAGSNVEEVKQTSEAIAKQIADAETTLWERIRGEVASSDDPKALNVALDLLGKWYDWRQDARMRVDKLSVAAIKADNPPAWEAKWRGTQAIYSEFPAWFDNAVAEARHGLLTGQAEGYDWFKAIQRYAEYDDFAAQAERAAGSMLTKPGDELYSTVIEANRQFLDATYVELFTAFKRYASQDSLDILASGIRKVEQMGAQTAAAVAEKHALLLANKISKSAFYDFRNKAWLQFFDNAAVYNRVQQRLIVARGVAESVASNLRWVDEFAGGEFQLIGRGGDGYWEARHTGDDVIHRFADPGNESSAMPTIPANIIADFNKAIGNVEATVDEVLQEVATTVQPAVDELLQNGKQLAGMPAEAKRAPLAPSRDAAVQVQELTRRIREADRAGDYALSDRLTAERRAIGRSELPSTSEVYDMPAAAPVAPERLSSVEPALTLDDIRRVANEAGIQTATDAGRPMDRRLVNTINKDLGTNYRGMRDIPAEDYPRVIEALEARRTPTTPPPAVVEEVAETTDDAITAADIAQYKTLPRNMVSGMFGSDLRDLGYTDAQISRMSVSEMVDNAMGNVAPVAEVAPVAARAATPSPRAMKAAEKSTPETIAIVAEEIGKATRGRDGEILFGDLRPAIEARGISWEEASAALQDMQLDGGVTLMRLDDPQAITRLRREGNFAEMTVSGDKRHLVYPKQTGEYLSRAAAPQAPTQAMREMSIEEFGQAVQQAANQTTTNKLGEKVFISQVYETLRRNNPALDISLDEFKAKLVEANRARAITLTRADMAYALDQADVQASFVENMNSGYHFIRQTAADDMVDYGYNVPMIDYATILRNADANRDNPYQIYKGVLDFFGMGSGGNLYEMVFNLNAKAERLMGEKAPEMGEMAAHTIRTLGQAEDKILNNLEAILGGKPNTLTPAQQLRVVDELNKILPEWDNLLAGAAKVGEDAANFAMLNYNDRRNIDAMLGFMSTYHYYFSRTPMNWLKRVAMKPSILSQWFRTTRAIRAENEQTNQPQHLQGTIANPFAAFGGENMPDRLGNPLQWLLPFSMVMGNEFANPDEARSETERWYTTAQKYLPGFAPVIQFGMAAYLDETAPLPDGKTRTGQIQLGDFVPLYRLGGYANQAATGDMGAQGFGAYGDEFDYGRAGKQVALQEVRGDIEPGQGAWGIDVGYQNQTGADALPEQPEGAEGWWQAGAQRSGLERLIGRGMSYLTGVPGYFNSEAEQQMRNMKETRVGLGYDPVENPYGSREAVNTYTGQDGDIYDASFNYSTLYPGGENRKRPGVAAASNDYWNMVNPQFDQMSLDSEQYLTENPNASSRDLNEIKKPYWDEIKAIGETFPSVPNKVGEKETFNKPRNTKYMSPEERAEYEVRNLLNYKPGVQPEYPGEDADPKVLQKYYKDKAIWDIKRLTQIDRNLNQLFSGETASFPDSWMGIANDLIGGKYSSELMRMNSLRNAGLVEKSWSEVQSFVEEVSDAEFRNRTKAVTDRLGAEGEALYSDYLSLPKGEERDAFKEENPEVNVALFAAFNAAEYDAFVEKFGQDALVPVYLEKKPEYPDNADDDKAMQAYYKQLDAYNKTYPMAEEANLWVKGRRFGPDAPNDDYGRAYEEAVSIFGEDIFDVIRSFPSGGTKAQISAWYRSNGAKADMMSAYRAWKGEHGDEDAAASGDYPEDYYPGNAGAGQGYSGPRPVGTEFLPIGENRWWEEQGPNRWETTDWEGVAASQSDNPWTQRANELNASILGGETIPSEMAGMVDEDGNPLVDDYAPSTKSAAEYMKDGSSGGRGYSRRPWVNYGRRGYSRRGYGGGGGGGGGNYYVPPVESRGLSEWLYADPQRAFYEAPRTQQRLPDIGPEQMQAWRPISWK